MFLNLFRKIARPRDKSIQQVCDNAFEAYGAPPKGTTERLAVGVRHIHVMDKFPSFLEFMSIAVMPSKQEFTVFVRESIVDSVQAGYSKWSLDQSQALGIRMVREPGVEITTGLLPSRVTPRRAEISSFPGRNRR